MPVVVAMRGFQLKITQILPCAVVGVLLEISQDGVRGLMRVNDSAAAKLVSSVCASLIVYGVFVHLCADTSGRRALGLGGATTRVPILSLGFTVGRILCRNVSGVQVLRSPGFERQVFIDAAFTNASLILMLLLGSVLTRSTLRLLPLLVCIAAAAASERLSAAAALVVSGAAAAALWTFRLRYGDRKSE